MKHILNLTCAALLVTCGHMVMFAQSPTKSVTAVPRLVKFGGKLADTGGKPLTGVVGVTFSIYETQEGGAPIWMESQNIEADAAGEYTALLGSTKNEGIPTEIFGSGQRWLGIQPQGEPERPRILLTSVPYSLKAVDAETLGGLPASAYALAGATGMSAAGSAGPAGSSAIAAPPSASPRPASAQTTNVTGTGTAGTIAVWSSSSNLASSVIIEKSGNIGIGVTPATTKFDVVSAANAIFGQTTSDTGIGVGGQTTATSGQTFGVVGDSVSPTGGGVQGQNSATTGVAFGVTAVTSSVAGTGVAGLAEATSGENYGVAGQSNSSDGVGAYGTATATTGSAIGVYGVTASDSGYAVWGDAQATSGTTIGVYGQDESTTGYGVEGQATATSGDTVGVYGKAVSTTGTGVEGIAIATTGETIAVNGADMSSSGAGVSGTNSSTTGETYGVIGATLSDSGIGMWGVGTAPSTLGGELGFAPLGVWGDTHYSDAIGVLGTADDGYAIAAYNNATNVPAMFVENQEDGNSSATVFATYSDYGGFCDIFVNGNLSCSGSVGGHAVLSNGPGGSRDVALYSVQSPENWFEDMGAGQLHGGAAVVKLDPDYAETVNTGMDYHVFLTPKGDCKGLYVANESATSFEVHELGGGTSSIAFDYRIVARRKGFENVRMADLTGKIARGPSRKIATGAHAVRTMPRFAKPAADPVRPARKPSSLAVKPVRLAAGSPAPLSR